MTLSAPALAGAISFAFLQNVLRDLAIPVPMLF